MKKFFSSILVLALVFSMTGNVFAANTETKSVKQVKVMVNNEIDKQLKKLEKMSTESEKALNKKSTKKEVLVDFRNNDKMLKKSLSEPVTIYEEVVITRYSDAPVKEASREAMTMATRSSSVDYEVLRKSTTRTFNGVTTTVVMKLGYYIDEDVTVDGDNFDFYSMDYSNIYFSASGDAHVSYIRGNHHQRGINYDNDYRIIIDGKYNSGDRSTKSFSISSNSGRIEWDSSHSDFSGLSDFSVGGCIGTNYFIDFCWPVGGGNYEYDQIEKGCAIGNLPY